MKQLLFASLLSLAACGTMTPAGDATAGATVYTNNACGSCHGQNAEGTAAGPNISGSTTAGIGSYTQDQFNKSVREGVNAAGKALCANMAKYPKLTDTQTADLFAFLKSKTSENKPAKACP
jgi:cytochrome c553